MLIRTLLALVALCCCLAAQPAVAVRQDGRQLLQQQQVPINCSATGDSWARESFTCSIPPAFTAACQIATAPAPTGNVHCSVINDEKPNVQTGLACPVKDCVSVCDLVVMQNFFPPDVVTAFVELLAAWKPSVPGC